MRIFGFDIQRSRREEVRASIENPTVPVSASNFLEFFGVASPDLTPITVERAMSEPAVFAAVNFLPRTLAALPLHAWRQTDEGPKRISGGIDTLVSEAPTPEWTSFGARAYFWRQVFTRGRGLFWIERSARGQPVGLVPVNVARTTVTLSRGRRQYMLDGQTYDASEMIDVPFALHDDQCGVISPIARCAEAIGLALDMQRYARKFFAGGGVPPLALVGPLPANADAINRAKADVQRSIDTAQADGKPILPIPAGYKLEPVAFDPDKGQMTDARRFQLEEIARIFQLPPVFLQDLSKGTFTNTEQQDLFFVKHLIGQWATALEQEMNLKIFGQMNGRRYVDHNLDGLQRGDFKSRMEGTARSIQTGLLTPNEARELEGRAAMPGGDKLYMQGATVPLGSQPVAPNTNPGEPNDGEDGNPDPDGQA